MARPSCRRRGCEPIDRARRITGEQPLQPLFTLLTIRHQLELSRDDGARVALALDRLSLEDTPAYRETEIEIELFDGDERAVAELALWLMRTYGVLPSRGSKRGRALAWRRGLGLPVVGPALALDLLAERAVSSGDSPAPIIALASPHGSSQAAILATALVARLPGAVCEGADKPRGDAAPARGPLISVGAAALAREDAAIAAWVKVGLPQPLLDRLIADAAAAAADPWAILRRLGEYVVPSQRRFLDPVAREVDLIVIDNAPPGGGDDHQTPIEQGKLLAWPTAETLARAGAVAFGAAREEDHFFRPPVTDDAREWRVRLRDDTAWVSFPDATLAARIATYEARPRVVALLHQLGYAETDRVIKERRRYRLGGWEIALDRVAGVGHCCEMRRVSADARDLKALVAVLGLTAVEQTGSTYRALRDELAGLFADSAHRDGRAVLAEPPAR